MELDGQRTTHDSGALLLREALDNSGMIAAPGITWSTSAIWIVSATAWPVNSAPWCYKGAMGWIDLNDTTAKRSVGASSPLSERLLRWS